MDRRRGTANRPASSEATKLSTFSNIYANPVTAETIGRINRLISAWPQDDTLPAEGLDSVKTSYKKLASGLEEISKISEREVKAIDDALEQLGILIALRKAPEPVTQDKRNKRPRQSSPAGTPTPSTTSSGRGMSITIPPRTSVGPSPQIPFSREPKARREALHKQLPLQEGRKVAFHQHVGNGKGNPDGEGDNWILAVVLKSINADKNRYEVQDPEPDEDGVKPVYNTTLRSLIPLPDPTAPPGSASHLSAYQEFAVGATVMALYPDTSVFYRAEVLGNPKTVAKTNPSQVPTYKLKFEDDEDQEHLVAAQWVVEYPGI